MVKKQFLFFGFLLLALVPFCLALENDSSLGTFYLFGQGEPIVIEDAIILVCVFILFAAVIYGILSLIGIFEKTWMKLVISFIVVYLMNSKGFLFNTFYFFKDSSNIVTWFSSLTFGKTLFILLVSFLIIALLIMWKMLILQWKRDAKKEKREMESWRAELSRTLFKLREGK